MLRARLLPILSLLVACARTGPTRPVTVAPVAGVAAKQDGVPVVAPGLRIRFEPRLAAAPSRLAVEVTARGIAARRWAFASAVAASRTSCGRATMRGTWPLCQVARDRRGRWNLRARRSGR